MKSCPTCKRTFEDTFTFCLADGSLLDAPFDPHATSVIPDARQTEPPPTEVITFEEKTIKEIPPTIASPQPQRKPQNLASTMAAPRVELPGHAPLLAQPVRKPRLGRWMIIGVLVLVIGAIIFFLTRDTANKHVVAATKIENESKSASKFREAEAEWRQAVRLEPNNAEWHWKLGFNLAEQQKFADAEAEYREAVRLMPSSALYHYHLAQALEKQDRYAEAEAEYREALRLNPDSSLYRMDLDRVLAHQGKENSPP